MWAIVPVKRFGIAKQRLLPVASAAQRAQAARVMAEKVLSELACAQSIDGVLVVSGEESLRDFARKLGFEFLRDPDRGLNEALENAMWTLSPQKTADLVIIHADLPLFSAAEFDRVAALHAAGGEKKMTIVPDAAGEGTNLRFCRPGCLVPPLFGGQSAIRHREAARDFGMAVELVISPTLALDCDTPTDVARIFHFVSVVPSPPTVIARLAAISTSLEGVQS